MCVCFRDDNILIVVMDNFCFCLSLSLFLSSRFSVDLSIYLSIYFYLFLTLVHYYLTTALCSFSRSCCSYFIVFVFVFLFCWFIYFFVPRSLFSCILHFFFLSQCYSLFPLSLLSMSFTFIYSLVSFTHSLYIFFL